MIYHLYITIDRFYRRLAKMCEAM
ncbi:unnamed protein product [Victoria cruziana]